MKKLVVTILTLLSCGTAYALPVGNPSEASLFRNGLWWESCCCDPCDPCFSWCDAWSLRIGFYGDYVFNRHMEIDSGDHENGADIDTMTITTNAGYIALNICDRLDVFGTLGATTLGICTDATSWGSLASLNSELGFETYFSWSVGARATLWQWGCFGIGVEGQYFETRPDLDYFIEYNGGTFTYFNNNNGVRYYEWQVGLGASYKIATSCPSVALVPYAAVKWAGSKLSLDNFSFVDPTSGTSLVLENLEAKKLWGYAIGVSFTLCDLIGLTVEGRWADEKALYVNGQFRF